MEKEIDNRTFDLQKTDNTASIKPPKMHFDGFDYLRVFFMMMVLLGHSGFFYEMALTREKSVGMGHNLWDYLYFEMQSSAVPSFILLSMVLFAIKKPNWASNWDRVKKLGYLYAFWVGAWIIATEVRPEFTFLGLIVFFLRGGGWLFYTFATLILLTPLCWIAYILPKRAQWCGLFLATCAVIGTYLWTYQGYRWIKSPYYWLPSCFVMMPFIAVILTPHIFRLKDASAKRYFWIFIMLSIGGLAALIEWYYSVPSELVDPSKRNWVPKHARLSVQFFAIAMLIASLGIQKPVNGIIRFFARNSLGVYCLHPFMLSAILLPVKTILQPWVFGFATPIGCIVVAIVCSFLAEFLRLAFKQRLV